MNNKNFNKLLFESQQQFENQLNQGFKEGVKKVGKSLGRIAKSTASGASVGAAVGAGVGIASRATGNSQKGSVAVGAGIGAVVGGAAGAIKGTTKQVVNGTKKLLSKKSTDKKPNTNKKPESNKKLNQDIDTFDNFTDLDFQKFEDDYLQNQGGWDLDIDEEMQSLNEDENNFKPKLSVKKQIGTYKEVTIGKIILTLIEDTSDNKLIILNHKKDKFSDYNLISILDYQDDKDYNWWHADADYDRNEVPDEVLYCIDNFDALMK